MANLIWVWLGRNPEPAPASSISLIVVTSNRPRQSNQRVPRLQAHTNNFSHSSTLASTARLQYWGKGFHEGKSKRLDSTSSVGTSLKGGLRSSTGTQTIRRWHRMMIVSESPIVPSVHFHPSLLFPLNRQLKFCQRVSLALVRACLGLVYVQTQPMEPLRSEARGH